MSLRVSAGHLKKNLLSDVYDRCTQRQHQLLEGRAPGGFNTASVPINSFVLLCASCTEEDRRVSGRTGEASCPPGSYDMFYPFAYHI